MNSLNSVLMEGQVYKSQPDGNFLIVCKHSRSEKNIVMSCFIENKKTKPLNKDKVRVIGSIIMKNDKLVLYVETIEYKPRLDNVPYSQLKENLDKILKE